jgi:hypothetical protein
MIEIGAGGAAEQVCRIHHQAAGQLAWEILNTRGQGLKQNQKW